MCGSFSFQSVGEIEIPGPSQTFCTRFFGGGFASFTSSPRDSEAALGWQALGIEALMGN